MTTEAAPAGAAPATRSQQTEPGRPQQGDDTRLGGRNSSGRPRSWTDAQLLELIPVCSSMAELARKLGLRSMGGATKTLRRHAKRLGVELPRSRQGGPRRWSDEDLRRAVKGDESDPSLPPATSISQVSDRLGLSRSGISNQILRAHMRRLALPIPEGRRRSPEMW